ncbi:MAG: hypothetical protein FJ279_02845, partial [Planctomycetes bacterium]|nr:hypothetical protein [Planctomycetota bacterium]
MAKFDRYDEVLDLILWTKQRWRAVIVTEGVLVFAALMLAVVLVSAGLEAWVHFSALARKLILASWLACAVGGAVIFIFRRILAEWHEEHVALHVEAALPGLKNGLINTIRLAKEPWLPSPSLANQAVNEVAANVKQFDFGVAIDRRGVVRFGV